MSKDNLPEMGASDRTKRPRHSTRKALWGSAVVLFLATAGLAILISCNGTTSNSPFATSTSGQVTTIITDPPTCSVPNGSFTHVWVTITKVTANISATAVPSDSGWQTLVDLTANPRQIDLFSLASPACVLTQLGSTASLPTGNYQQIRLYLLGNSPGAGVATPSPNNCSTVSTFNCVQTALTTSPLVLSSEAQTGLKIPPGQISGGALTVQANQAVDLSIDFNACASILQQGNGTYRLKPTLTAGVVSVNNNAISGTVVAQGTSTGINGAIVLLEQPDSTVTPSIDRVRVSTVTDSSGHFIVCPLPGPGPYDVVVAAATTSGGTSTTYYNPTIAFGVPMGTNLGNIPLAVEGTSPTQISGQVGTQIDSSTPTVGAVTISPMQDATPTGGSLLHVTIPVYGASSQPPVVTTTATPTPTTPACASGTDCYNYTLVVPGSNALVATYDTTAKSITFPTSAPVPPVNYNVNALDRDCTTPNATTASPATITAGGTTTISTALVLFGCPASM